MYTKYIKTINRYLMKRLEKYEEDSSFIVAFDDRDVVGYIEFIFNENLEIRKVYFLNDEILSYLFSKLYYINHDNKLMSMKEEDYSKNVDFFNKHLKKDNNLYSFKLDKPRRFIPIGKLETGKLNNIADVSGVKVGHFSLQEGSLQTGITAILPHDGNLFKEKVVGASYCYNGFGKSIGLMQVDELGTIETPILLTNTLNLAKVSDGLLDYMLDLNEDIGVKTGTINPLVLECNDGDLNDIRTRKLGSKEVTKAISDAKEDFLQGAVGAGSGMTCHGFKGGIGSSSRKVKIDDEDYHVGVLVNSNFQGSSSNDLIINNVFFGNKFNLAQKEEEKPDQGSIIMVVATNIPLSERQLKRVLKRAILGLARTGSYVGNGSGDIVIGFSTANKIKHYPESKFDSIKTLGNNYIDNVFKACIEATEEAIINSLLYSRTTRGVRDNIAYSINEQIEVFDHFFIENILGE